MVGNPRFDAEEVARRLLSHGACARLGVYKILLESASNGLEFHLADLAELVARGVLHQKVDEFGEACYAVAQQALTWGTSLRASALALDVSRESAWERGDRCKLDLVIALCQAGRQPVDRALRSTLCARWPKRVCER